MLHHKTHLQKKRLKKQEDSKNLNNFKAVKGMLKKVKLQKDLKLKKYNLYKNNNCYKSRLNKSLS